MSLLTTLLARLTTPKVSRIPPGLIVGVGTHHPPTYFFKLLKKNGVDLVILDGIDDVVAQYGACLAAKDEGLLVWSGPASPKWGKGWYQAYAKTASEWWERYSGPVDYTSSLNEPDLYRFLPKEYSLEAAADVYNLAKHLRDGSAPHIKLVEPNVSTLGSSSNRGWQFVIHALASLGCHNLWDFTSIHVYRDSPGDTVDRFQKAAAVFTKEGFKQPFIVGEFGWKSRQFLVGNEGQARFLTNTLSRLGGLVHAACIYELADAPGGSYGLFTTNLTGKASFARLSQALLARPGPARHSVPIETIVTSY